MEKEEDMPELKNTRKLLYCHSKRALATEESCKTDKGLRPLGAPNEDYDYRTDCQLNNQGVGCAYYVLTFGNQDYLNK